MKLLKDYNCTIDYHPSKMNVVANGLSRKTTCSLAFVHSLPLMIELRKMGVDLSMEYFGVLLDSFLV